jgi:hypothetical protein
MNRQRMPIRGAGTTLDRSISDARTRRDDGEEGQGEMMKERGGEGRGGGGRMHINTLAFVQTLERHLRWAFLVSAHWGGMLAWWAVCSEAGGLPSRQCVGIYFEGSCSQSLHYLPSVAPPCRHADMRNYRHLRFSVSGPYDTSSRACSW